MPNTMGIMPISPMSFSLNIMTPQEARALAEAKRAIPARYPGIIFLKGFSVWAHIIIRMNISSKAVETKAVREVRTVLSIFISPKDLLNVLFAVKRKAFFKEKFRRNAPAFYFLSGKSAVVNVINPAGGAGFL